ncbi:flagellar hook-associated protein FlgK [Falsiphaeobacter marinintestinus]|uniref:flagellar hook-associated protein FlgK n=1 Tax=Falsiphaeobacter marinintestinus TaxID=1492905 RepID=UPI0011B72C3C|nr:flagellar hook-associated protein FlgK [Phaeobacter marinintestinus]
MSLSSALNSAMSGLTAASRASLIVSDNIANAMTPGYGRRSLELASDSIIGSGVRIVGIDRNSDPALTASRRSADAEHASAETFAAFLQSTEALVGSALDEDSLSARLAAFDTSLITAASAPESTVRLNEVAQRAADLAQSISNAADGVQSLRGESDKKIADFVDTMNDRLARIQDINIRITAIGAAGDSAAAMVDQRQVLIDEINEIVPINVVPRDHGQVALYSDGGAILLDGSAVEIGFEASTIVTAQMAKDDGGLSGLDLNGMALKPTALDGGALGAQFRIRDDLGPELQSQLDQMAEDLIARFETTGLDRTLAEGEPGLFTDAGLALDSTATTGLANRLTVNVLVAPDGSDETWHLRDGFGAAVPGEVGDATLLQGFSAVLAETRFLNGQTVTASDMVSAIVAGVASDITVADNALSFAATSRTELERLELEQGVDTDAELQTLMIVERAYAANARIVQAVEDMMDSLMRI